MVQDDHKPVAVLPIDPVAGNSVAEIFGEIVWLMSQNKEARDLPIKDLEWLVMPPILLKQFHITHVALASSEVDAERPSQNLNTPDAKPKLQPVGVELYALCSESVVTELDCAGVGQRRLSFQDWQSGPIRRVVSKVQLA